MAEPATKKKTSLMIPDWSKLPEELLDIISKNLDNCFDVVHARSICCSWRSAFQFPSCLLRPSYSLPAFGDFPYVSEGLCTLQKTPLFLFRLQNPYAATLSVPCSMYYLGGVSRDMSEDHMEFPSPNQCSVKNIPGCGQTVMNMLDFQILPLGHEYRMIGWDPESWTTDYKGVAFLPLNKEGESEEFVVLLNYTKNLLVLRSNDMRWMWLKETSEASCCNLLTFRGRFYATFSNDDIFVFDPYSLIRTPLLPFKPLRSSKYLVRYGDDEELFLVEWFNPFPGARVLNFSRFTCRVSMLDEAACKWVEVSDLGDRVLFIGHLGNVCCSAKELPDGCGVSGNSIVFTNGPGNKTYAYKYGVNTGIVEDELNCWRLLRENLVTILSSDPAVTLRVDL